MAMNISNCNFLYPKLYASPSYGEAMRYHAEFREGQPAIDNVENYPEKLRRYLLDGVLEAFIDWGEADSSDGKLLSEYIITSCTKMDGEEVRELKENPIVEMTVYSIGCRPAMTKLASLTSNVQLDLGTKSCSFTEMSVTWSDSRKSSDKRVVGNPEYLVMIKIFNGLNKRSSFLQRTLHVAPPHIGPMQFRLRDIVWSPKLFQSDHVSSAGVIHSTFNDFCDHKNDQVGIIKRRRGFGLELETVQLPLVSSDFEAGCFTQQQQFEAAVNRARTWHLKNVIVDRDEDYAETVKSVNSMWDQLLLWSVSHDLYVENAAPPSRIDLYQRIRAHIMDPANESGLACSGNNDILRTLDHLVLGGNKEMPSELLRLTTYDDVPKSQASPEYKSPLPPNELYHEFPPPLDGKDSAYALIRLFLDGVLKNPLVSTKPVAVPLVSDLGQSATSIHVHVNVTNPNAWPRNMVDQVKDLERTQSLLCVIFAWICFDRVVERNFCMPNVWRDRSFAPMLPTGPEFVWRDLSWDHGSSVSSLDDDGTVNDVTVYNLPAWFHHVYSSYISFFSQEEKKESTSLFETVFDHDTMTKTISRWNSLNLLPINSYGTIEFRRMHASLDADFVSAWTWFCVGFVERFSSPGMWDKFLFPFLQSGLNWKMGLDRLAEAQNNATIEDLLEMMSNAGDHVLPTSVLQTLVRNHDYDRNK